MLFKLMKLCEIMESSFSSNEPHGGHDPDVHAPSSWISGLILEKCFCTFFVFCWGAK